MPSSRARCAWRVHLAADPRLAIRHAALEHESKRAVLRAVPGQSSAIVTRAESARADCQRWRCQAGVSQFWRLLRVPGRCHLPSGPRAIANRDYPAAASLAEALGMCRDLGDRRGRGCGPELRGRDAGLNRGQPPGPGPLRAGRWPSRARSTRRMRRYAPWKASGRCLLRDGDPGDAVAHWRQALTICQHIGASDAQRVQETLSQHGITTASPPPSGRRHRPSAPAGSDTRCTAEPSAQWPAS